MCIRDSDNCLIDPSLPVGGSADTAGQQMNYWPRYGSMSPGSRLAFLNWMASQRNAPDTYIGYVFVYFYALERRAILERSEEDRAVIEGELVRLLEIYGGNRSFHRYGTEMPVSYTHLRSASLQFLKFEHLPHRTVILYLSLIHI